MNPQFSHNPRFIAFRSWTVILSLKGTIPNEIRRDETVLFMNEAAEEGRAEVLPVRKPVCLKNASRVAHRNVTLVCEQSGEKVFFARELPSGRFLHLEFLREGEYTLHYSPAFSEITLHRELRVVSSSSMVTAIRRFHPQLQTQLQTRRGEVRFNSPFSEYNEPKDDLSPEHRLPISNKEETAMNTKRKLHDGIVGAVLTVGSALAYYVDPLWILVPGLLGITLLQSGLTGFCPLYYILDKTCKPA